MDKSKNKCFCFGEVGHYSWECPKKGEILRDKWTNQAGLNHLIRKAYEERKKKSKSEEGT